MATWLDGPEYAPTVRPGGFLAASVPELDSPAPQHTMIYEAPIQPPSVFVAPHVAPLEHHAAPPARQARNPQEQFDVGQLKLATGSWSFGVIARDPRAPFQLQGRDAFTHTAAPIALPAPALAPTEPAANPGWFVPQNLPDPARLTWKDWYSAMTPALFFALAIGCLPVPTAPVALVTAAWCATRLRYRRTRALIVMGSLLATALLYCFLALVPDGQRFAAFWEGLTHACAWFNGVGLALIASSTYFALCARDIPESPSPDTE
ncbi:MAG: hypothetical protein ACRCWS_05725 [Propionibacteriaceae bacterium]